MAGVGGRVGKVVRSEPRSHVGVSAGQRTPILGEVRRQLVRVQEGGPENILSATEQNFVQLGTLNEQQQPGKSPIQLTDGDPILIGLALEAMADKSLSLCRQTMAPARNPFAPKSLLIPYRHKIRAGLQPASFLTTSDRMLVNEGASGISADSVRDEKTERGASYIFGESGIDDPVWILLAPLTPR